MTAVIYARYSSDNQREESIEGQIRECTAYAEKNDITIVKHYIDRAISAKTDNRPQFQQMIKDSDKKLFDIVLVWKLDRFARNRYDSARYKTQLKKNGVKLMSATEIISEGFIQAAPLVSFVLVAFRVLQRWMIEFRVARGENVFDPAHPERNTPESFIEANAGADNATENALNAGIDNRIHTIKNSNEEER